MDRHHEIQEGCQLLTTYDRFRWLAQGWIEQTLGDLIIVGPTSRVSET